MSRFLFALLAFGITSAMAGADKVKQKAGETVEASKEFAAETKKEYEEALQKEFNDLSADIKELRLSAKAKGQEAKAEVKDQLGELEKKREEVAAKMKKLGKSTGKAWTNMKEGVESAWNDLKAAYSKAAKSFNE